MLLKNQKQKKQILYELPLYLARTAADIIATTAVALKHTHNPYRKIIPHILIPVVHEKLKIASTNTKTYDTLIVKLKTYHETKTH